MRRFVPLLPLPFIVAVAALGSALAADAAGAALARGFASAARFLVHPTVASPDETENEAGEPSADVPASTVLVNEARPSSRRQAKGHAKKRPAAASPSIFVSARKVLSLSQTGVAPRGTRVRASGARPAGLRMSGVEALGIGLREGDVLTRALGRPALSPSEVVKAVLVARARRVKVLEGEFYRGAERWILRVEQPYLDDGR